MGMDAKVAIWAGVRLKGRDELDRLQARLPEDWMDSDGVLKYSGVLEKLTGHKVGSFDCCDDVVGFGVSILAHDWDYGVINLDLGQLDRRSLAALQWLRDLFDRQGIDSDGLGVWCQTDYR